VRNEEETVSAPWQSTKGEETITQNGVPTKDGSEDSRGKDVGMFGNEVRVLYVDFETRAVRPDLCQSPLSTECVHLLTSKATHSHHLCSPVDDHCAHGMAGVDPDRGGEKMRGGSPVGSGMRKSVKLATRELARNSLSQKCLI